MKLPIYIVSDNHFLLENTKKEQKRRDYLFEVFKNIKKTGGSLIIGGDFFDFWLESINGPPFYYDNILNELEELNNNDIEIHYVLGNHDYWDNGYFKKKFRGNIHKKDFSFSIKNKKILITHGDGLLKHDYLYRIMKKILRNKLIMFLLRLIPRQISCKIARKISNTKNKFGKEPILDKKYKNELKQFAIMKMQNENFDAVLMGHYHQIGIENINDKHFIHLGDWINNYTITQYDNNYQWKQKNMTPRKDNK